MPPDRERAGWPEIGELVPHAPPMLLLTRVLSHETLATRCEVDPGGQTFFRTDDGDMPCWVALEYMAQCVAVHAGLQAREQEQPPRVGFVIGSPRLRFHEPSLGGRGKLEVSATYLRGRVELGAISFDCALRERGEAGGDGRLLAEGRISIAIPAQPGPASLEGGAS